MNKEPIDIEKILPYGEMLRGFMEQPFISKSDLKSTLRHKGIFTSSSEKQDSIPILVTTLLSSDEFDYLRECQNTKEDNPKVITQSVKWDSKDSLLDSLPDRFDVNTILDLEFSNFTVSGTPNFVPIAGNPNHLKMEFNIEREDLAKNWASNKSTFSGSLELERVMSGDDVKLIITHTADETKYVGQKASQSIVKHFRKKNKISENAKIEKILFSQFSNPNRINYFMSLTREIDSHILTFSDIVDIEFSPDKEKTLPENMEWMQRRIEDLKINGQALHKTFFFDEASHHEFILLYKTDARYKFDIKGLTGQCVISVGFPEYGKYREENSEFEVNVKTMNFDDIPKGTNRMEIKKILLRELESMKMSQFKIHADLRGVA